MEEKIPPSDSPIQEHSWSPAPSPSQPIHSKMDWLDEVHFRFVRGVEVHPEDEPNLHPEPA
jgi:hypothetical protein